MKHSRNRGGLREEASSGERHGRGASVRAEADLRRQLGAEEVHHFSVGVGDEARGGGQQLQAPAGGHAAAQRAEQVRREARREPREEARLSLPAVAEAKRRAVRLRGRSRARRERRDWTECAGLRVAGRSRSRPRRCQHPAAPFACSVQGRTYAQAATGVIPAPTWAQARASPSGRRRNPAAVRARIYKTRTAGPMNDGVNADCVSCQNVSTAQQQGAGHSRSSAVHLSRIRAGPKRAGLRSRDQATRLISLAG